MTRRLPHLLALALFTGCGDVVSSDLHADPERAVDPDGPAREDEGGADASEAPTDDEPRDPDVPPGERDEFLQPFTLPTAPSEDHVSAEDWDAVEVLVSEGLETVRQWTDTVLDARGAAQPLLATWTNLTPACPPQVAAVANGQAFASLEAASASLGSSGVLLVCPGTHATSVTISGRTGQSRVVAPLFPSTRPRLVGVGDEPILHGSRGPTWVVLGLDLAHATHGITMSWGGQLVVAGNHFSDIEIAGIDTSRETEHAVVAFNTAEGGRQGEHGFDVDALELVFVGNRSTDHVSDYEAGGAKLTAHRGVIAGNVFAHNVADYEGGGLEAYHETFDGSPPLLAHPFLAILGNHFEDNVAGYEGGGMSLGIRWTPLHAFLVDNTWVDNDADGKGNGISCTPDGGDVTIVGDRFVGTGSASDALDFSGWNPVTPTLVGVTFQ